MFIATDTDLHMQTLTHKYIDIDRQTDRNIDKHKHAPHTQRHTHRCTSMCTTHEMIITLYLVTILLLSSFLDQETKNQRSTHVFKIIETLACRNCLVDKIFALQISRGLEF